MSSSSHGIESNEIDEKTGETAQMSEMTEEELDRLGQALVEAVFSRQPRKDIQQLLDDCAPAWYQDEDGCSPLHAAAYCEDAELIRTFLDKGAVWNAVDNLGNTAGDIALSLNNQECYDLIRDEGMRTELVLQLMMGPEFGTNVMHDNHLLLRATDDSAMGSTDAFLASKLRYTVDESGQEICLLQTEDSEVGVMMGWEREIMHETVEKLCADHPGRDRGLKILNVGFGLGIIDTLFQSLSTPPALHVIIEPHSDVLQHMRDNGWYNKPGVEILEGTWQDFVTDGLSKFGGFDAIYTDTFAENYEDLHKFFKHVPNLLADSDARFSFFNGLGATNPVFYDVYTKLVDLNLSNLGLGTLWHVIDVEERQGVDRWGRTRQYFSLKYFMLPVCHLK